MATLSLMDEALKHSTNAQLQRAHKKNEEKMDAASTEARLSHYDNDAKYNRLMNRAARHEGARDELEGEMRKRVRAAMSSKGKSHTTERENVTNTQSQHAELSQTQPTARRKVKVKRKGLPARRTITLKKGKGYKVH